MKKTKKPWEKAAYLAGQKKKQLDRKRKFWKFYFFLFVGLPIFIIMLTVRVVKTFVRIKLLQISAKTAQEPESSDKDETK